VPEVRRHHANDGVEVAIDADLLSKSLRITAERTPPETVAEHDTFNKSRLLVVRGVDAAQLGPGRQHGEIIGARREKFDALRFFAPCEIPIGGIYSGNVLENTGTVTQVP
jgi:hypothetical protein